MNQVPIGMFCDFDGTISKSDLITSIANEFAGQTGRAIVDRVQRRELSIQSGVEAIFHSIPSSRLPDIIDYTRSLTVIRDGFDELVQGCISRGWMFAVVSGGLDVFVDPVVEPYRDSIKVFCNHLDDTGEHLAIRWMVECDADCDGGCGLCKPSVLRQFRSQIQAEVVIGDGVTDLKAAAEADYVFARDRLRRACDEQGISYWPFESLSEIIPILDREVQNQSDL